MPWIEDAELQSKLVDVLQKAGLEVATPWTSIVHDSNLSAYNFIVEALLARGYTISQLNGWDSRTTYNIDLGLFWCLVKGGCTKDFDETFIMLLDRRLELLTLEVVVDGEIVPPDGGGASILSGTMTSDADLFTL